jgi:hypothetical protein
MSIESVLDKEILSILPEKILKVAYNSRFKLILYKESGKYVSYPYVITLKDIKADIKNSKKDYIEYDIFSTKIGSSIKFRKFCRKYDMKLSDKFLEIL